MTLEAPTNVHVDLELDARGLSCPLPLLKAKQALHALASGQVLHIAATDAGSWRDIQRFAELSGHALVHADTLDDEFHYWLRKS
ncbi:MAG: sulfurtransferase TusA family protein [Gammaproteobacteria bacterium]|nr:sulfurtransferase TusA family protein [Gammaproteobacteria bacterium]